MLTRGWGGSWDGLARTGGTEGVAEAAALIVLGTAG